MAECEIELLNKISLINKCFLPIFSNLILPASTYSGFRLILYNHLAQTSEQQPTSTSSIGGETFNKSAAAFKISISFAPT